MRRLPRSLTSPLPLQVPALPLPPAISHTLSLQHHKPARLTQPQATLLIVCRTQQSPSEQPSHRHAVLGLGWRGCRKGLLSTWLAVNKLPGDTSEPPSPETYAVVSSTACLVIDLVCHLLCMPRCRRVAFHPRWTPDSITCIRPRCRLFLASHSDSLVPIAHQRMYLLSLCSSSAVEM